MTNNQGSISIKGIIIILSLFLVAVLFIILGVFFSYKNNSEKIITETLNTLSDTTLNFINKERTIELNESYTIESSIKTTSKIDENNEDIKDYKVLLSTLPKLNTNITISQDKENSKIFYSINSKKNNEKYINLKYLVKESTGYYYNDSITNKYINLGTNNYFETLQNNQTLKDNKNYLNSFIIKSLAKNISQNYSSKKEEKIEINNKQEYANKITIELDNTKANKLYKNVITDLKKDEKSLYILENIFYGFKNRKIKNKKFLKNNEKIIINIYTKGLTNKLLKIEIIDKKGKTEKTINYEKIDNSISNLYILSNNTLKYKLIIHKKNNNQYDVDIQDNKKDIGKIILKKTTKETIIDISTNNDEKRLNIDYIVSLNDIKNNKYRETVKLDIKYIVNNKNIITQSTEIINKIDNKAIINEDTSESILEKALTKEQVEKKDNYKDKILKEIMGDLYGKEENQKN